MVDSKRLLSDLTRLLGEFEADLRQQVEERADIRTSLMADYQAAKRVKRTQDTFETWIEEPLTQAAVAWILGTVFARFLEDNGLVEPRLSGTDARHRRALQEHQHYFQQFPTHSDRDYLEDLFARLACLPAMEGLFDRRHNPLWRLPLSADAARQLVEFWQRIDPDAGRVSHDFQDDRLDTRFLGDLYQDLSEPVRKRYALLQTPEFVEEFILDRTLTPAIETFGYREVRLIDPTCGSGHFLLGTFRHLLALMQEHEPARDIRSSVADVLSRVVGVDINPYAVAIARFRLTVAALTACGIERLADAPGFDVPVVVADSLLHGPRFAADGAIQLSVLPDAPENQYYFAEDEPRVRAVLGRRYHAVVGNPPYITVKDPALSALYRERYRSCHRQYALVVPFMERFFELALPENEGAAGYVGLIVSNSFMKREFGKKLIEQFIPKWDLTHVVDTSGAYIPGHGTPTVIIFGRNRTPETATVRAVMGIRGEPSAPDEPASGQVWVAILKQIDAPDSESAFLSTVDLNREALCHHPWSIGGGGASSLKDALDLVAARRLEELIHSIGFVQDTHADEAFVQPRAFGRRRGVSSWFRPHARGEEVRDWKVGLTDEEEILFPFGEDLSVWPSIPDGGNWAWLWALRVELWSRRLFTGETYRAAGKKWYEYHQFPKARFRITRSIVFAEVASHNHFALDSGGRVFNRTAPVIKMPISATEDDHLALLGLLNSSTGCFWMKQVCADKGNGGIGGGISDEAWERRFVHAATKLQAFPVVETLAGRYVALLSRPGSLGDVPLSAGDVGTLRADRQRVSAAAIGVQEELDWSVYRDYRLTDLESYHEPIPLSLGQRAFEIVMARKVAAGQLETTWFERHGSTPITELPVEWPDGYKKLVENRIALIEGDRYIRLIEQPEYKRRWNTEPFDDQLRRAARSRLLDRLELRDYWPSVAVTSTVRLADLARKDAEFMQVAEVYTGHADFNVHNLVDDLVRDEAVPHLPVLRYTESGLRKRAQWERTWELQRQEDAIDASVDQEEARALKAEVVGEIPVPPKYTAADFKSGSFWRLRGKLDVPKERFISYPGCERAADGSMAVAWAGWDHAQQAKALGDYYMQIKDEEGSASPKLIPLLAGLLELLPWIRQWHPGPDPEFGVDLGETYESFVDTEARALGTTVEAIRVWSPPSSSGRSRGRTRRT